MKTEGPGGNASMATVPQGFHKRLGAGFACPACGYKGWHAFVATGRSTDRRLRAWFWCPSCRGEFLFRRQAWLWLGLRVLFLQLIAFAALYALVMMVQGQPVPWVDLIGVAIAAVCLLLAFTLVLRRASSYSRQDLPKS